MLKVSHDNVNLKMHPSKNEWISLEINDTTLR